MMILEKGRENSIYFLINKFIFCQIVQFLKNKKYFLKTLAFLKNMGYNQIRCQAGVMELADVTDSKSVGATRAGSSPATGTKRAWTQFAFRLFLLLKVRYSR